MHAQEAVKQIDTIISTLTDAREILDDNDTDDFDIDRKLNIIEEVADEVSDYVSDQT